MWRQNKAAGTMREWSDGFWNDLNLIGMRKNYKSIYLALDEWIISFCMYVVELIE